jgi:hypothetical protein
MPNYLINYETTGPQANMSAAVVAIEAILERYDNGMTIHARGVMPLGRDRGACNGWVMFDGQFARLFNDAYHLHEADNIILTEV